MAQIDDVAEAILIGSRRNTRMGNLALQQLCYLAQGVHLAVHGEPLFSEALGAEIVGSASLSLRDTYGDQGFPEPGSLGDASKLTAIEASTVTAICDQYGHMMGQDLCAVVTEQLPWLRARERATDEDLYPVILEADMRSFFRAWLDAPEDDLAYANRFADRYNGTNAQSANFRALSGAEWPSAVGKLWDGNRSQFATPWDSLAHHDQLTVYRLLASQEVVATSDLMAKERN